MSGRALLGELLIAERVLTRDKLEEAMRAQAIYGGRLGTCLVEMGLVREDALAALLSRQLGVPTVSGRELSECAPEAIEALSAELAGRYRAVPFKVANRRLLVAMADPSELEAVHALEFAAGLRVYPFVAPEHLIVRALERYYGIPRPLRYIRLDEDAQRQGPSPISLEDLVARLLEASKGSEILARAFDFFAARFEQAVVFLRVELAFQPQLLRARSAEEHERLGALTITAGTALCHALTAATRLEGPLPPIPEREAIAAAFGVPSSAPFVMLPVASGAPPWGMLLATRRPGPMSRREEEILRVAAEKSRQACNLLSMRKALARLPAMPEACGA